MTIVQNSRLVDPLDDIVTEQTAAPVKAFDFVMLARPDEAIGKDLVKRAGQWAPAEGNLAHDYVAIERLEMATRDDILPTILRAGQTRGAYMMVGSLAKGVDPQRVPRAGDAFVNFAHYYFPLDYDGFDCDADDIVELGKQARALAPAECRAAPCVVNITRSHRFKDGRAHVRLWFQLSRPMTTAQIGSWLDNVADIDPSIDKTLYQPKRIWLSQPRRVIGGPDPIPTRWALIDGEGEATAVNPSVSTADAVVFTSGTNTPSVKGKPAHADAKADDPAFLTEALAAEFYGRVSQLNGEHGRHVVTRLTLQRFNEYGFSAQIAVAAIALWLKPDDMRYDALVTILTKVGCTDAEQIADRVRRIGNSDARVLEAREKHHGAMTVAEVIKIATAIYRKPDNASGSTSLDEYRAKTQKRRVPDPEGEAAAAEVEPGYETGSHPAGERRALMKAAIRMVKASMIAKGAWKEWMEHYLPAEGIRILRSGVEIEVGNDNEADDDTAAAPKTRPQLFLPAPVRIENPDRLPPRKFVFNDDYCRGFVNLTTSPGGRGKSSLLLAEAVGMAIGRTLDGTPTRALRVLHWSLEDPLDELLLRVGAIQKYHRLPPDAFNENLFLMSGRDHPLKIITMKGGAPVENERDIERLTAIIRALRLDVVQLGPMVSLATTNESDTRAQDMLIKALSRVAGETNAAIHIASHTRKPSRDSEGVVTSYDNRGATSTIDGARGQRLLNPMTKEECRAFGVAEGDRWRFIKLSDGKNNMKPGGAGSWLELKSQTLFNATEDFKDSSVQVIVPWKAPIVETVERPRDPYADKREALARVLANTPGVFRPLKDVGAEAGNVNLTLDTNRAGEFQKIMGGPKRNEIETPLGRLVSRKDGKTRSLALITSPSEYAAPDEEEGDCD